MHGEGTMKEDASLPDNRKHLKDFCKLARLIFDAGKKTLLVLVQQWG
jgi:hypothetical protein